MESKILCLCLCYCVGEYLVFGSVFFFVSVFFCSSSFRTVNLIIYLLVNFLKLLQHVVCVVVFIVYVRTPSFSSSLTAKQVVVVII